MINWKHAKTEQPTDNAWCFITAIGSKNILGPILYKAANKMWMDLFATPEGGHVYEVDSADYDLWWCAAQEMNIPEEKE